MKKRRRSWAFALAILLTGCSFAPRYEVPQTVAVPANYKELSHWKPAQPLDTQRHGPWWHLFQDPQLNALEAKVDGANQDLKSALARLQQARAETRIARADYFPTITAGPSVMRGRASVNGPDFVPGVTDETYNDFLLDADLSYEVDVWGRVRNEVASAKASQQASAADFATLDLSIHAELASDYYTLRSQDSQVIFLDKIVGDYVAALKFAQNLYKGGDAPLTDVAQAQAQFETARTQAEDMKLQRARTEHAIAVLIGENPSIFHIDLNPLPSDQAPPFIDPGLPSTLLERRPDVAAAERRVASVNAEIGVVRAAYFPVFNLSAIDGFESTQVSNWLDAPSRTWSLGPSAVFTVFDAGRHRAQSERAYAVYDEEVADYRATVLTAYQEVENNLAALRQLQREDLSQTAAVIATAKALQQANYRYKGGIVTYLEVVSAENASLQAQLSAANVQMRRMIASVLLIKALGGGWQGSSSRPQT